MIDTRGIGGIQEPPEGGTTAEHLKGSLEFLQGLKVQQYPTIAQNYRLDDAVSWLILLVVLRLGMPLLHCESLCSVAISLLNPDTQDDYGTNCVVDEVLIKVRRGQMLFFLPSDILRSLVPRKITFFNVEVF